MARALTGLADCMSGPVGMIYISEVAATQFRSTETPKFLMKAAF